MAKAKAVISLSKQEMKLQYKKCAMDPLYFLNNYTFVQHPTRGKVPFKLYPFQEDTIKQFIQHSWNIIVKSRQLGISTLCAGYALWLMTFNRDKSILVIANKQDVAKNVIRKVRVMYQYLPTFLQQTIVTDNKQSIFFANDSFIKAQSANPNAGVSEALSLLIIDEAAVLSEALFSQIWAASAPTLSTGGDCIILSTPRGVGGKFHKLWIQAQQGSSKFNPISLPWQVHPERDQAFRDQQTIEMGDKKARQQFDCDFASSGDTVIIKQVLQKISNTTIIQPIQKLYNNEVWIWAMPQFEKTYIISADVARGDGADFSGFEIICVQDNEQVGQYKGKIATDEYGRLLIRFAKMYNNAFLIVENANIGWAVLQQIFRQGYANVYYHKKDYKYVDLELESKMQSAYKPSSKQRDIPGFVTSSRTRPLIIQKMVTLLQNGQFVIHSKRLMNQLWTFVWTHGKPEAMRGYNDDLVMAFAIGLWVRMTSYIIRMEAKKFTHQRLSMIDSGVNRHIQSGEKMPASGFYNSRHINQESPHLYKVGNETINILDFYFGHLKNNKDKT